VRGIFTLIEELQSVGAAFVSLGEGIDCQTAAGKQQLHILAELAEFERARIADRVKAGLSRVRAARGRPCRRLATLDADAIACAAHLSVRVAASTGRVSASDR
jgi:putative DNA-invertase from lambdoid prophage Rac